MSKENVPKTTTMTNKKIDETPNYELEDFIIKKQQDRSFSFVTKRPIRISNASTLILDSPMNSDVQTTMSSTVSSLSTNSAKTFTCTECGKVFNAHYNLTRHMPVHTGARPFVCTWPDCDQRFNRKYNLNRHLWIHAENKNKNQQQPQNHYHY